MPSPLIYVIPEAYYGGAVPKVLRQVAQGAQVGSIAQATAGQKRKIPPYAIFWGVIGILFLVVVAVATWYFTRDLRKESAQLAAITPPAEQAQQNTAPEPVGLPTVPEIPPADSAADGTAETLPEIPAVVPPLTSNLYDDIDNDGLTSAEEDIYKTQSTRPDTDSDGFLDGHEVLHLYNPAGVAPERLEETQAVRRFKNESLGYSLLIPTVWKIIASLEDTNNILIQTETGEAVVLISVINNSEKLSLSEWYGSLNPGGVVSEWKTNKAGLNGIVSQDKLNGYFEHGDFVYKLEYKEIKTNPTYIRTFEMMLNSFQIGN